MENPWINHLAAYHTAIRENHIPQVYRGLIDFMLRLRTRLLSHYPSGYASSGLSPGYLDISYFPFTPLEVRRQKLKVAVVFNHPGFRFEVWLCGQNKAVQKEYWEMFKASDWDQLNLAPSPEHSILEEVLVAEPDFKDEDSLLEVLEEGIMRFNKLLVEALT